MDSSPIRSSDLQGPPIPSADEVKAQVRRIIASRGFRDSARIQRFLQLAVERTLAGQSDQLKEYTVGRDVFDRNADYDPRADSIVRVEAQRLRRKLREYYQAEGGLDPVVITFPRGSYVPGFARATPQRPTLVRGEDERTPIAHPPDSRTVAVLPFSNLSAEPKQQYFCDGITEDIITALASVPELQVIGRTSTFALKSAPHDLREIGSRLGAGTIVEGAVRKVGATLRISAKILDSETGQVKWSQVFDRKTRDLFSIEDEIARSIADTLRITLGSGAPKEQGHKIPRAGAHVEYLKGRQAWNRMTLDGFVSAVALFKSAIRRYPDYAPLHAGLADAYSWLAIWGMARPREALRKSRSLAREALRLDSNSALAYSALGSAICFLDWEWEQGLDLLKKAILLQPSYAVGQQRYGMTLMALGRFNEAMIHLEQAVHLDPLSIRTNRTLGGAYYLQGRATEARQWLEAAIALQPESAESRSLLVRLYLQSRNYKAALEEALKCDASPPSAFPLSLLGVSLARNGDKAGAERTLKRLVKMSSSGHVDPLASAYLRLALDDRETALELLGKSLDEHSPFAAFIKFDPLLDELRSEPGFSELVSSMKFPASS